ncbi:MAG TPA: Tex family protein [Anaerovoracaceae bacterium]|nr:Tex family protein [Anaerovoracaceae bacterium]
MIVEKIAKKLGLALVHVEATIKLIDEGNTIPFIARYRKEATGGMSDVTLRELEERLTYLRNLEARKEEVIRLIEEQGKMTEALHGEILEAEVLQRVEDLYKPYKQKRATRASKAREKGLEPLAVIIRLMESTAGTPEDVALPFVCDDPNLIEAGKGAASVEEALSGAADIIAENIADDADFIQVVRQKTYELGLLVSEAVDPEERTVYDTYYDYREALRKIPNHRILAINRGEKEKKLKVKLDAPLETIYQFLKGAVIRNEKSIFLQLMDVTVEDAYKRLMAPSIERELRNQLTERAEKDAIKVFAKNTENLLMAPPLKNVKVLAIDPGFRTGCKVTVVDETGKLLAYTTIYPTKPRNDIAGSRKILTELVKRYGVNVIAIGNGTASRETEVFVSDMINEAGIKDLQYTIVNEAGASIYSASKLATEEYPDLDVTTRGAMSIGRRLQDPLAELVKISPKHIGVGQYQHDINQGLLDGALANVVEDCVNRVGVDLNTASSSLLSYIAGINSTIAKNIVAYREEKGRFSSRKELLKVARLGEKTFNQCAGFMRIHEGANPLDGTAVHPESYSTAELMLKRLGISKGEISKGGAGQIEKKIEEVYGSLEDMAMDLDVGKMTLSDIVGEMKKPARDPREGMPPVVFRRDVLSIEDLKPDMELTGTVRNVVDFGAFVDIGVKNDGLVHISQLSNKFVKNPMDVVGVGDTVKVKVISVDSERQNISLTMRI